MDRLLTAEEVVALVGGWCGKKTVLTAAREGRLASVPVGRGLGFYERDVEAWLASLRKAAVTARIAASVSPRSAATKSRTSP